MATARPQDYSGFRLSSADWWSLHRTWQKHQPRCGTSQNDKSNYTCRTITKATSHGPHLVARLTKHIVPRTTRHRGLRTYPPDVERHTAMGDAHQFVLAVLMCGWMPRKAAIRIPVE
jgi:hypothetical protein